MVIPERSHGVTLTVCMTGLYQENVYVTWRKPDFLMAGEGPPPLVDEVVQVVTPLPRGKFDKICLHAQRLCLLSARALDQYRMHPHALGDRKEGLGYALFCSAPFYHSMIVRWLVSILFVGLVGLSAIAANNLATAGDRGKIPPYQHYRFTALETRAGLSPETPGIHTFGLLRAGEAGGGGVSTYGALEPCMPLPGEAAARWAGGASMTLSVAERSESPYAMWYITTQGGEGTQPTDAVKFVLEGSDDGEEWVRVGSSKPRDFYGAVYLTTDAAKTPLERGAPLVLSATLSFSSVYCNYIFSLGNWVISGLAVAPSVAGRVSISMWLARGYHYAACLLLLLGCYLRLQDLLLFEGSLGVEEFAPFINVVLRTVAVFILFYIFVFRQEWADLYWYTIGFGTIFRALLHHQLVLGRPYESPNLQLWVANIFWILFGTIIMVARLWTILRAHNAIQGHKARYNAVWERVVAGQRDDVRQLQSVVTRLLESSTGMLARQLTRGVSNGVIESAKVSVGGATDATDAMTDSRRAEQNSPADISDSADRKRSFGRSLSMGMLSNRVFPTNPSWSLDFLGMRKQGHGLARGTWSYPAAHFLQSDRLNDLIIDAMKNEAIVPSPAHVKTLDQLYAQAFLVQDIFLNWVSMLASQSRGTFRLRRPKNWSGEPDQFAAWDGSDESRGKFAFGGLKGIRSSVHKLDVAYKRDVSRLLDVVRETIFFDNVGDLQRCLDIISRSKIVEVVRVKSTMTESAEDGSRDGPPSGEEWSKTGMRFVRVNVRFLRSNQARTFCVDTHVCELLLMLTDFGRMQTNHEAEDYREWRKCRRELQGKSKVFRRLFLRFASFIPAARRRFSAIHPLHRPAASLGQSSLPCPAPRASGGRSSVEMDVANTILQPSVGTTRVGSGGAAQPTSDVERTMRRRSRRGSGISNIVPDIEADAPENLGTPTASLSLSLFKDNMNNSSLNVGNGKAVTEGEGGQTSWGSRLSSQVVELLEAVGRISSLGLSDFLDTRWEVVRDNQMDESSLSSVVFSAYPVSGCLQRWQFRVFFLGFGIVCLWIAWARMTSIAAFASGYAAGPYRYFRLETMLTRDGGVGADILGPGVSDFGIVGSSGCHPNASYAPGVDESVRASFSLPVGSSFVVGFPEARAMRGWYLNTGTGPVAHDPAFFSVWATNDDPDLGNAECASHRHSGSWWAGGDREEWCGAAWDRVGTPKWRFIHDAGVFGAEHGAIAWVRLPVELPLSRTKIEKFLLQPPSYLYYWNLVLPPFVFGMTLILSVFTSMLRVRSSSPYIPTIWGTPHGMVAWGMGFFVLCFVIGGSVAAANNVTHLAIECFVKVVPWTFFTVAIGRQGPQTWRWITFSTVLDLASSLVLVYWYHGDAFAFTPSLSGLVVLFLCLILFGLRRWELHKSRRLLEKDRKKYDALWESQCANEDNRACLEHLAKVVNMIGLRETDYCRQHNRMRADQLSARLKARFLSQAANSAPLNPLFWDLGHWYVPGRPSKTSQVTSLTQLYCMASIANLILLERLKDWAYRSQGLFPVEGDRERFVKWRDVCNDPEAAKHVLWAGLKRHRRTMEKLLRSYNNDLGRLLDVSRNLIVFDNMSDLTMALGIIVTDENVRVERLKNRLSYDYNAEETGGYRDVCINLRVVNKEAFALGAELHMCEVQLILKDFANLRSKEGHRGYVLARNLSGR